MFQKDGNPLPSGRTVISGGNLTLQDIREEDRGIYQCAAFNEAATITAESELMVENVAPRAPYNVSAETTKDSVTVKWKSGFTKPKLEFSVWYRLAEFSDWKSLPALSRDIKEITIDKLLPGREYEIMVLSQDIHGDGMFSKSIKVKTQGQTELDSPTHQYQRKSETEVDHINSPRNINVALTSEGWLVTWDPPDNGVEYVDHYTVRWSQGKLPAGSADTTNTFFLVKDLEEDETYHFQVFVVSKNDSQAESSKFLVHTPSYRKVRAVSLGLGLGFIFLIALVLIAWFVRRHYHQKRLRENAKRDRVSISS